MDTCLLCNQPIINQISGSGRPKKYCSEVCQKQSHKVPRALKCKQCNQQFEGAKGKRYCSTACRQAYNEANRKIILLICTECGTMYESHKTDSITCSLQCKRARDFKLRKMYQYICQHCHINFESPNKDIKYCSTTCVGEAQRLEAIERAKTTIPRHIFPNKEARREYIRRKRIRENFVDDVKIEILIERDKGVCQLCNEPVLLDVHYQHPLSATNDHVIPISLGGEHSYANCQLAHRKCNTAKNNRVGGEMNG